MFSQVDDRLYEPDSKFLLQFQQLYDGTAGFPCFISCISYFLDLSNSLENIRMVTLFLIELISENIEMIPDSREFHCCGLATCPAMLKM